MLSMLVLLCVLIPPFFNYISGTARDIVKYLCDKRVASVDDFNWVAQLRYYWRYDDVGKC